MYTWELRNGWAVVIHGKTDVMRVKPTDADWVTYQLNAGRPEEEVQRLYGV